MNTAFGMNAQPRIFRYGSSRGLGITPTRKIPVQPDKLYRYFCLCIYKGPARQVVSHLSFASLRIMLIINSKSSSDKSFNPSMAVCKRAGVSSDSSKNWLGVI